MVRNDTKAHAQEKAICSSARCSGDSLGDLRGAGSWFDRTITEKGSGVRFFARSGVVYAGLGAETIALPDLSVQSLLLRKPSGQLSEALRAAFYRVVVPQLILPVKEQLLSDVASWKCSTDQLERVRVGVQSVSLVQDDPLIVSIRGIVPLLVNRAILPISCEFIAEWSDRGAVKLTDKTSGRAQTVPLGAILKKSHISDGVIELFLDAKFR